MKEKIEKFEEVGGLAYTESPSGFSLPRSFFTSSLSGDGQELYRAENIIRISGGWWRG